MRQYETKTVLAVEQHVAALVWLFISPFMMEDAHVPSNLIETDRERKRVMRDRRARQRAVLPHTVCACVVCEVLEWLHAETC